MYLVNFIPSSTTYFTTGLPGEGPWEVETEVELDLAENLYDWPDGTPMPNPVVCGSKTNPKYFKVFKHPSQIDETRFESPGRQFGGLFSSETWQRFAPRLITEYSDLREMDASTES